MDFFLELAQTILATMLLVIFFTSVASFLGVDPAVYSPYLLFYILLLAFRLFI